MNSPPTARSQIFLLLVLTPSYYLLYLLPDFWDCYGCSEIPFSFVLFWVVSPASHPYLCSSSKYISSLLLFSACTGRFQHCICEEHINTVLSIQIYNKFSSLQSCPRVSKSYASFSEASLLSFPAV